MTDEATIALYGFLSGIGVSVVAALFTSGLEHYKERRRRIDAALFSVYLNLLEIHGSYFWATCAELHNEQLRPELRHRLLRLSWKTADLLRETDGVPQLESILRVLLSEEYPTANDRYLALGKLLDELGRFANPRYQSAMNVVSRQNQQRMSESFGEGGPLSGNAPGRMWL